MSIFISFESLDRFYKLYFKSISHTQKKNVFKLYLKLIVFGQKGFRRNYYNKHRCLNQYVRRGFLHLANPFRWRTRSWDKNKKTKKHPVHLWERQAVRDEPEKLLRQQLQSSHPTGLPQPSGPSNPHRETVTANFGSFVTPKVNFTETGDPSKFGHWW